MNPAQITLALALAAGVGHAEIGSDGSAEHPKLSLLLSKLQNRKAISGQHNHLRANRVQAEKGIARPTPVPSSC